MGSSTHSDVLIGTLKTLTRCRLQEPTGGVSRAEVASAAEEREQLECFQLLFNTLYALSADRGVQETILAEKSDHYVYWLIDVLKMGRYPGRHNCGVDCLYLRRH